MHRGAARIIAAAAGISAAVAGWRLPPRGRCPSAHAVFAPTSFFRSKPKPLRRLCRARPRSRRSCASTSCRRRWCRPQSIGASGVRSSPPSSRPPVSNRSLYRWLAERARISDRCRSLSPHRQPRSVGAGEARRRSAARTRRTGRSWRSGDGSTASIHRSLPPWMRPASGCSSRSRWPSSSAASWTSRTTCSRATPSKCCSRRAPTRASSPDMGRFWRRGSSNEGKEHQAFRWVNPADAEGRLLRREGRSLRRFVLASPLRFKPRVTSGFSRRRLHPVFRTVRAHLGVDYAAPTGTPVVAVANGVVVSAGWAGGGGRQVRIRHASGFESYYLHLSSFAKGISAGAHVDQGQLIGRVGATGTATGPHLDYRLRKNGVFVDPGASTRASRRASRSRQRTSPSSAAHAKACCSNSRPRWPRRRRRHADAPKTSTSGAAVDSQVRAPSS